MEIIAGTIEEIAGLQPGLFLEHHMVMAVAVLQRIAASPCDFDVVCEGFQPVREPFVLRVHWRRRTARLADKVVRSEQRKPIVERAAVALSALLLGKTVPKASMIVTAQGEHADYWLPEIERALEISGTDGQDILTARIRSKKKQVSMNPLGWSGYAVVCCFAKNQPTIRWSEVYHAGTT